MFRNTALEYNWYLSAFHVKTFLLWSRCTSSVSTFAILSHSLWLPRDFVLSNLSMSFLHAIPLPSIIHHGLSNTHLPEWFLFILQNLDHFVSVYNCPSSIALYANTAFSPLSVTVLLAWHYDYWPIYWSPCYFLKALKIHTMSSWQV